MASSLVKGGARGELELGRKLGSSWASSGVNWGARGELVGKRGSSWRARG